MRSTTRCFIAFALCLFCASRGAAQPTDTSSSAPDTATPSGTTESETTAPTSDAVPEAPVAPEAVAATQPVESAPIEGLAEETESEPTSGFRNFMQENVAIHGFGTFQAGWTHVPSGHNNHYTFGSPTTDFQNVNFSLRQLVQPLPELRFFAGQSFTYSDGKLLVELDLAGAQWAPTKWFAFRVGRILSPVGIYTEVYRVGTLRPFGSLPTSVYGNAGFIAQSYDGGELQFTLDSPSGWNARFSAFAGHSAVTQDDALVRALEGVYMGLIPRGSLSNNIEAGILFGGNVRVDTPIDGLGVAFGAMGSTPRYTNLVGSAVVLHENNVQLIASAYYIRDKFELRSELAYRRNHDTTANSTLDSSIGYYAEASYRPIERLQMALRYEYYNVKLASTVDLTGKYASFKHHNDVGGVVSYWFTRDFVLKLEYHFVDGNRFAHPFDVYNVVANGQTLSKKTHFLGFTSSFSF